MVLTSFTSQISSDNVSYTIGQLALLETSGYSEARMLTTVYANAVEFHDVLLEASLGLEIETIFNKEFYSKP